MKKSVVMVFFMMVAGNSWAVDDTIITVWNELPRVTLFERLVVAGIQSVAVSAGVHFTHMSKWGHIVTPTLSVCVLGPTIVKGLEFKNKIEILQKQTEYEPTSLVDPLFYITCITHPFDLTIKLTSGAQVWKAYTHVDAALQRDFAVQLFRLLDYTSFDWALRSVADAKELIERRLKDLQYYSDVEERLRRLIYLQFEQEEITHKYRYDLLTIDPAALEPLVEEIIDSGTYYQPMVVNTVTKSVNIKDVSPWYQDDFVYYYASWYGFELIKAYCRLLAFERIWSSFE